MIKDEPGPSGGILLVAATLDAGGTERQLAAMANHWASMGRAVSLVSWHDGLPAPDFYSLQPGVGRIRLRLSSPGASFSRLRRSLQIVRALRAVMAKNRPACVISFITENNVIALLASLGLGLRVVVSERAHPGHDTTVSSRFRWLRRWLYPMAERVVVQTNSADRWMREHGCKNSVVIPNVLRTRESTGRDRELLVLGVGRLTRQKGFDLLLQAFAVLRPQFPEWRLVILGEGPERSALTGQAGSLGISDAVFMPGVDSDVSGWMSRAALVVQPSRFEGFPNAVMEAMAEGAAVISADCAAGPAELIQDGVNGRLVPSEDVDSLVCVMQELMATPGLRARLGYEARKVRERFHEDNIMPLWGSLLSGSQVTNFR